MQCNAINHENLLITITYLLWLVDVETQTIQTVSFFNSCINIHIFKIKYIRNFTICRKRQKFRSQGYIFSIEN